MGAIDVASRDTTDDDGGFDEVGPPPPSTDVVPAAATARQDAAIAAAAEAALAMPGLPGRDEFLTLAMTARMLHMSGAAPEPIRESVYVAFHVAMVGRDLGISPSAAIELIDVLKTRRGYQLSLSPQLINGQVRRLGLGEVVPGVRTSEVAVAVAIGPGGRDRRCRLTWPDHATDCTCDVLGTSEYTWEDARIAGLVAPGCKPGAHTEKCRNRNTPAEQRCNQGYVAHPKRMLWWRAGGFAGDDYFPEAGLGLYSPEALGAMVDDEGRPVDPSTVALPEGYEPQAVEAPKAEAPADPDELWELQARLHGLPEPQQQAWREQKGGQDRLRGRPTHLLPTSALRLAKSIVTGLEAAARKADPDHDVPAAIEATKLRAFGRVAAMLSLVPVDLDPPAAPQSPVPAPGPDTTPEQPAGPQADTQAPVAAGPTAGEVGDVGERLAETVRKMSLAAVHTDLTDYGLSTKGGATACRKRLTAKLVADWLADHPHTHTEGEDTPT